MNTVDATPSGKGYLTIATLIVWALVIIGVLIIGGIAKDPMAGIVSALVIVAAGALIRPIGAHPPLHVLPSRRDQLRRR